MKFPSPDRAPERVQIVQGPPGCIRESLATHRGFRLPLLRSPSPPPFKQWVYLNLAPLLVMSDLFIQVCLCLRSLVHARLYAESRAGRGPHPLGAYSPVGRMGTNQMGTSSTEMSRKADL